jgi:hypothetical protein
LFSQKHARYGIGQVCYVEIPVFAAVVYFAVASVNPRTFGNKNVQNRFAFDFIFVYLQICGRHYFIGIVRRIYEVLFYLRDGGFVYARDVAAVFNSEKDVASGAIEKSAYRFKYAFGTVVFAAFELNACAFAFRYNVEQRFLDHF